MMDMLYIMWIMKLVHFSYLLHICHVTLSVFYIMSDIPEGPVLQRSNKGEVPVKRDEHLYDELQLEVDARDERLKKDTNASVRIQCLIKVM